MGKTFDLSVLLKLVDQASGPLSGFSDKVKRSQNKISASSRKMATSMNAAARVATVPFALLAKSSVSSAIKFESAWAGVIKKLDDTPQPVLNKLKKSLEEISLVRGIKIEKLFGIAEAGSTMGIAAEDIASFTAAMSDLITTTDIKTQESLQTFAQAGSLLGFAKNEFGNFGSVLFKVGTEAATTESRILAIAKRAAVARVSVNIAGSAMVGLSAGFAQSGLEAQAAGSSIAKTFTNIQSTIGKRTGIASKQLKTFANLAGLDAKSFEDLWVKDAGEGFVRILEGLEKVNKKNKELEKSNPRNEEIIDVQGLLTELGLGNKIISRSLLAGTLRIKELRKLIQLAKDEEERAKLGKGSILAKSEELSKTTENQIQIIKNAANLFGADIGDRITKKIKENSDAIKGFFVNIRSNFTEAQKDLTATGIMISGIGLAIAGVMAFIPGLQIPAAVIAGSVLAIDAVIVAKAFEDKAAEALKKAGIPVEEVKAYWSKIFGFGGFAAESISDIFFNEKAERELPRVGEIIADSFIKTTKLQLRNFIFTIMPGSKLFEKKFQLDMGQMMRDLKVWARENKKSSELKKRIPFPRDTQQHFFDAFTDKPSARRQSFNDQAGELGNQKIEVVLSVESTQGLSARIKDVSSQNGPNSPILTFSYT